MPFLTEVTGLPSNPTPRLELRGAQSSRYVARQQAAGLIDIARPQGTARYQAVILIGPRSPADTARHCEYQSRICRLQTVEAGEQRRGIALGRHQRVVKGTVGGLKVLHRLGIVCTQSAQKLDPRQMSRR